MDDEAEQSVVTQKAKVNTQALAGLQDGLQARNKPLYFFDKENILKE
jgi:hypothetical protein